jgi:hypothetical protein
MVLDHSVKPITQDLVKNRLMAEYNRRQLESETVSSKTALVVSSKPNQTHGELICGYCKKKGHIKRDCFKRKASEARKIQKNKNSPKNSTKVPTKMNSLYAALHSKQWDSSGTWCIDSGSTHHMSNSDQRMNKYQDLKEQSVSTAASDNHLSVQGKGEIAVNIASEHVQVKYALHVPNPHIKTVHSFQTQGKPNVLLLAY